VRAVAARPLVPHQNKARDLPLRSTRLDHVVSPPRKKLRNLLPPVPEGRMGLFDDPLLGGRQWREVEGHIQLVRPPDPAALAVALRLPHASGLRDLREKAGHLGPRGYAHLSDDLSENVVFLLRAGVRGYSFMVGKRWRRVEADVAHAGSQMTGSARLDDSRAASPR